MNTRMNKSTTMKVKVPEKLGENEACDDCCCLCYMLCALRKAVIMRMTPTGRVVRCVRGTCRAMRTVYCSALISVGMHARNRQLGSIRIRSQSLSFYARLALGIVPPIIRGALSSDASFYICRARMRACSKSSEIARYS